MSKDTFSDKLARMTGVVLCLVSALAVIWVTAHFALK